ncbi:MAG: dihydropteroate synthase [Anaerolineales bacterium]|jgi:5-methyltetrahydrofolate--homocysteine methyltransferase|uniref:dihydropteroate synthase n=1 Tax=Candidatus Villigracilis vicinus TaxID=3140679 RepID=UPI003136BF1E|nr:dihydropteroate synthase [Anaerolineales bacterium]MBK7448540.1 dihydropteroate synthase [Anaerolineales bacterium]MBK9782545.1 dihydropteroate synthase [Anaerolineales bacterium]
MHTILKSEKKEVTIGFDKPFVIIGEKLNPTGIKKLGQALVERNMDYVKHLAKRQVDWGADVLDINVGHPQIEEAEVMPLVVEAVQSVTDVPLCIDSNEPKILEAGLNAIKGGKPLVNSVNGEEKQLSTVLPIVKARGAAVIGLTIGDEGIPPTAEGRLAAAAKVIERAAKIGIPIEDIIIDPLVMTVGHDSKAATVTLKAIEMIKKEFDVNISLGASNVSFGLPDRHSVNAAMLSIAMLTGATTSITDPIKLGSTIRATDLLMGRDPNSMRYLKYFRATEKLREAEAAAK